MLGEGRLLVVVAGIKNTVRVGLSLRQQLCQDYFCWNHPPTESQRIIVTKIYYMSKIDVILLYNFSTSVNNGNAQILAAGHIRDILID
jgi:hypothetical protein